MKLHSFDASVQGIRLRGFTRDRLGAKLRRLLRVDSLSISVDSDDWKYNGEMTANKHEGKLVREILEQVRKGGFAITRMPELPTKFFVFDVKMDAGDLRVYSSDRDLIEFRKMRKRLELGTKGKEFQGEEEALVGEVEIPSKEVALRMGIDDYEGLQNRGYFAAVTRSASPIETFEKQTLRHLRKEMVHYGIDVKSFRVENITVAPSDGRKSIELQRGKVSRSTDTASQGHLAMPERQIDRSQQAEAGLHGRERLSQITAGAPILMAALVAVTLLGVVLVAAGLSLVYMGATGDTEIGLLGNTFKSQNVGVVGIFCGAVLAIVGIRRALVTVERLGRH